MWRCSSATRVTALSASERVEEAFKVDAEGVQIYLAPKATKALSRGNDANDVLHVGFLGMPTDMEE
jgi:hypothetical protein